MGMGGGGGASGGLGIGRGPADRIAVPGSWDDMMGYNPEVTRRALPYVAPYRGETAVALFLTLFAAIMMSIGPALTKVAIDSYISVGDIAGMTLFLALTAGTYLVAFLANWGQLFITTKVG